jgi:hypothetical protein
MGSVPGWCHAFLPFFNENGAIGADILANATGDALIIGFYRRCAVDTQDIGPGNTLFGTFFNAQAAAFSE